MAVQKILYHQIGNTGGTPGQVLIANSTSVTWGDANNSGYLGGVAAASYVNTTGAYTITGVHTYNANIVLGTAGISANGSYGTANQVLTSNGSTTYWANASGGSGGFTNNQSISVNNFVVTGTFTANSSAGAAGQTLVSNGAGVNWSSLVPSYNYSAQFNGSSSYLTTPNSSALQFGTGAFTVEAWVYISAAPTLAGSTVRIVGLGSGAFGGASYTGWSLALYTSAGSYTQLGFYRYDGTTEYPLSQNYSFSLNTWYHIVAVRNASSTLSYFVNGTRVYNNASASLSYNAINSDPLYVGFMSDGSGGAGNTSKYFNGFMSNVRIVKGTAVYDPTLTTLTVPTSPLSAISGTSLLTCNALTLTDSSPNLNVITNTGGVIASATSNPPFTYSSVSIPTTSLTSLRQSFTGDGSTTVFNIAGGYTPGTLSVYYNGLMLRNGSDVTATNGATITMAIAPQSGALIDVVGTVPTTYSSITPQGYSVQFNGSNYLSVADSAALQPGSSNFTVEAWAYMTGTAPANGANIITKANTSSLGPYCIQINSSNQVQALVSLNGSTWAINITGPTISLNTWYHIALVRNVNTFTLYVNGLPSGTGSVSGAVYAASGLALMVGTGNYATANFIGYISNARVVIGTAVYTGAFFPSGPLAAVQLATSTIGAITGTQTSLLTCNGPTIIDGSTNAFTITNNGSTPVSTAIVPTFTNVTINNPSTLPSYLASYLIVAGGGAGGVQHAGGGGGGGVVQGTTTLTPGTTYTVVVGGGGAALAGGSNGTNPAGNLGSNSSITGLTTALGGGGGGSYRATDIPNAAGSNGGSGGGGGSIESAIQAAGYGGLGGLGTLGQGYNGAAGAYAGGGGGGAGGNGLPGSGGNGGGNVGGAGGPGIASNITGSYVGYAGGGGGGSYNGYAGLGATMYGGANGAVGTGTVASNAGTTNTGGGGGGGAAFANASGAGGSGVVIISVLSSVYTGTVTGSPTVTTNGLYKVIKFTASGTYTA